MPVKKEVKSDSLRTVEAVNIAIPNTSVQKMDAIVELSKAIGNLSQALVSVQVDVTIANNVVTGSGGIFSGIAPLKK